MRIAVILIILNRFRGQFDYDYNHLNIFITIPKMITR